MRARNQLELLRREIEKAFSSVAGAFHECIYDRFEEPDNHGRCTYSALSVARRREVSVPPILVFQAPVRLAFSAPRSVHGVVAESHGEDYGRWRVG